MWFLVILMRDVFIVKVFWFYLGWMNYYNFLFFLKSLSEFVMKNSGIKWDLLDVLK